MADREHETKFSVTANAGKGVRMKDRIGLIDVLAWADAISVTEGTEAQASAKSIAVARAIIEATANAGKDG